MASSIVISMESPSIPETTTSTTTVSALTTIITNSSQNNNETKILPKKRKLNLINMFGSEYESNITNGTSNECRTISSTSSSNVITTTISSPLPVHSTTPSSTTTTTTSDTNNNQITIIGKTSPITTSNHFEENITTQCDLSEWIGTRILARRITNEPSTVYLPGVIKSFDLINCCVGVQFDSDNDHNDEIQYYRQKEQLNYIICDNIPSFRQIRVGISVAAKFSNQNREFHEGIVEEIVDSNNHNSKSLYRVRCAGSLETLLSRANLRLLVQPWTDEDEREEVSVAKSSPTSVIKEVRSESNKQQQPLLPTSSNELTSSTTNQSSHNVSVITMASSTNHHHHHQLPHYQPSTNNSHCSQLPVILVRKIQIYTYFLLLKIIFIEFFII